MLTQTQTVREIAQTQPSSIRVFEEFGIEYCCGSQMPLAEACAAKDVSVTKVITALEEAAHSEGAKAKNWTGASLASLTEYIVSKHHAYCKDELPRLSGLAARVVNKHGGTNPELAMIRTKLAQLAEELTDHLADEEAIVFPAIVALEYKLIDNASESIKSSSSIEHPIASLIQEHESAGTLLAEIRSLSHNFTVPDYACTSYRALYNGLRDFEYDLHRHVHLENNILFPRAIELEAL